MTNPERDDAFEAFLKRRTVLPEGTSDEGDLEPPAALDARVLNQARHAVQSRRRPDTAPRWAVPVALAATILLCFSVVLNVSLNSHSPQADLQQAKVEPAPQGVAPAAPSSRAIAPQSVTAAPPHFARSVAEPPGATDQPAAPLTADSRVPEAVSSPASAPIDRQADAEVREPSFLAKKSSAQVAAAHPQDPQTWLLQIEALRSAGKDSQADAEMRRFRAIFPAYPLKSAAPAPSESPK
jgi:hypothetical protein